MTTIPKDADNIGSKQSKTFDNTTKSKNTTSEGGGNPSSTKHSSEGAQGAQEAIHNNYRLPPQHSGLYSKHQRTTNSVKPSTTPQLKSNSSSSSTTKQLSSKSDYNIDIINPAKLAKFLKSYIKQSKSQQSKNNDKVTSSTSVKRFTSTKVKKVLRPAQSPKLSTLRNSFNHPMRLRKLKSAPNYTPFKHMAAQHLADVQWMNYITSINHIYNEDGQRLNIDKLLKLDPITWKPSVSNELGRLAGGIRNIKGNKAIQFVPKSSIPKTKKVTYANMVCDYRPGKDDPYRTRLTIGGDKLDYYGNASSPAASLLETKLIINSVISDSSKGARFASLDIKDHFLQSLLPDAEYMKIHSKYFFEDIKSQYDIDTLIDTDGYVYCKIVKGMYGLKQAAKLGRETIINALKPFGYEPDAMAPNLWKHNSRPTKFCLCIDDFGVKYFSTEDLNHLIMALQSTFQLSIDTKGTKYCGLTLQWNYSAGYVDVSMPRYVISTLDKLQHPKPTKPQHSPHRHIPPNYGQQQQFVNPPDKSPKLNEKETTHIQRIVGSFLYYGRAVDPTVLTAIN